MKETFNAKVVAKVFLLCWLFILICAVHSAAAREIAGVDVPGSITIKNNVLVLNGAGIRKKLFIKVYVGALYLTVSRHTAEQVLADPGAKSISMTFLYKKLSAEKIVDAWNDGFTKNSKAEELKKLQERIDKFNSLFTAVRKGDVIRLDYLPDEGTRVLINDAHKGSIPGADFYQALLRIWLGPKPVDTALKDDMLGSSY